MKVITKLLIRRAKKVFIEEQDREITIMPQKIYFIEDTSKDYHCSDGVFGKKDLEKKNVLIKSNTGKEFYILNADFMDSYKGIRKSAQTIPLKDLGYVIAETGIDNNSVVVDAGSGSGGSACLIAKYTRKVYTYDINDNNLEQTKKNVEYFGLKNVVVKKQDVYKTISNKNVDMILLDLPEPWNALFNVFKALKPGGYLVAYCPQITQTAQFTNKALELNFLHIKTVEVIERDWKIDGQIVRPRSLSNIHSGFISIMRKLV